MRPVRRWYRANIGGLPATYWHLWAGILVNRVGSFAILFLSLYLTTARHLSVTQAGLVVGANGVGGAVGVLLGGVLADRWGRRATLLAGNLTAAGLMLTLGLARWLPLIVAVTGLLGVAQSISHPAYVAAIVDLVPERDRTRAFNLQFWAFNLGMAVASLLAGMLAEVSFTLLFVLDSAATLVTFTIIFFRIPETIRKVRRVDGPRSGLRTVLTDRVYLVFVALTFLLAVLTLQNSTILPLQMKADGLRPSDYGIVTAFAGTLIVVGQLFVPRLIGDRRKGSVLALAGALLATGVGAVALAGTLPAYLAAATIWTVGAMLAAPPNAAVIAELAPPELRGRYQGVFFLTWPAAGFVAPALGGWSLDHLHAWHWAACAAVGLAAAGGHVLASGPRECRVAAARQRAADAPPPPVPAEPAVA
jgi:MFS family permease